MSIDLAWCPDEIRAAADRVAESAAELDAHIADDLATRRVGTSAPMPDQRAVAERDERRLLARRLIMAAFVVESGDLVQELRTGLDLFAERFAQAAGDGCLVGELRHERSGLTEIIGDVHRTIDRFENLWPTIEQQVARLVAGIGDAGSGV